MSRQLLGMRAQRTQLTMPLSPNYSLATPISPVLYQQSLDAGPRAWSDATGCVCEIRAGVYVNSGRTHHYENGLVRGLPLIVVTSASLELPPINKPAEVFSIGC